MGKTKRAALYVRVSTDKQTIDSQVRELTAVAERRGWTVVETYQDAGISGAKGRDKRPGLDAMLKDAGRRKFDVVMACAIDRLGRSLIDLLGTIEPSRPLASISTWTSSTSTPPRRPASCSSS
jgi:DNA invertase Pin-like site-specific DNA recombinase